MLSEEQSEQKRWGAPTVVRVGARLEFYEKVDPEGRSSGAAGSAVVEDAFDAVCVPRAGELVAVAGLFGKDIGQLVRPWTAGPFLRVVKVEHHPCPVPDVDGNVPDPGWTTPGVVLVFHAQAPTDDRAINRLNVGLRSRGWHVLHGPEESMY